jgi:hypothetical protein
MCVTTTEKTLNKVFQYFFGLLFIDENIVSISHAVFRIEVRLVLA